MRAAWWAPLSRAVRLLLLGCLLTMTPRAFAEAAPAPGAPVPVISLVTFGPGPVYWERFGHNALLVDDGVGGEPRLYNYGMFDFHQENFFLNFARGIMRYRLAAQSWHRALHYYGEESRWVRRQQLALDPEQARSLAAYLEWNLRPENAEYRYDYFDANCSTRVRDAIDAAIGGALRRSAQAQASVLSYRFEATRLAAPVPLMAIAMDLGMGPRGDRPLDLWQRSFVPMILMAAVREVHLPQSDGSTRPLVAQEQLVLSSESWPEPEQPRSWLGLALLLGLTAAGLMAILTRQRHRRAARIAQGLYAAVFCVLGALAGLILLLGWLGTDHQMMVANRNLLLFNPLLLLLLPACFALLRSTGVPTQRATLLAAFTTFCAAMTPLLLLLPHAQQNLPWIALLLPMHAALAWTLLAVRGAALRPIPR